ncbi:MAG: phage integrase SAM-like domain-containing protein [Jejuia sp.]
MATIKYELKSKSDSASIYLRLSVKRGLLLYRKTGLAINPESWSNTTSLPKQNSASNKNLNTKLQKLKTFVFERLNEANSNNEIVNGSWLKHQIDLYFERISESGQSDSALDAIQRIINEAPYRDNGKGGIGLTECRINGYKRLKELFQEFQSNKLIKVEHLDQNKFNDFKKWMLEQKGYSASYSLKKMSDLKTVCKDARSKGVKTSKDLNDIKTKQASTYDDDMDVIILTPEEIEKIENTHLLSEALINARKWLILACYTGQRGNALTTRIKHENFEKYGNDLVIKIRQKKGNKSVIIPVLPKVKEIYENGLPYSISMQKLNKHFKEIGKLAGLNEPVMGRIIEADEKIKGRKRGVKKLRPKYKYISTHIGRRTFASNHYGKIPTPIIMKVTGHSKESTFLSYINQTDDSHIETFLDYYKTKEKKEQKEPQLEIIKNVSN